MPCLLVFVGKAVLQVEACKAMLHLSEPCRAWIERMPFKALCMNLAIAIKMKETSMKKNKSGGKTKRMTNTHNTNE